MSEYKFCKQWCKNSATLSFALKSFWEGLQDLLTFFFLFFSLWSFQNILEEPGNFWVPSEQIIHL